MGSAARGRRGTPGLPAGGAGSPGMNGGRGMAGVVHGGMVREQEEGRRQRWAEVRQRFDSCSDSDSCSYSVYKVAHIYMNSYMYT